MLQLLRSLGSMNEHDVLPMPLCLCPCSPGVSLLSPAPAITCSPSTHPPPHRDCSSAASLPSCHRGHHGPILGHQHGLHVPAKPGHHRSGELGSSGGFGSGGLRGSLTPGLGQRGCPDRRCVPRAGDPAHRGDAGEAAAGRGAETRRHRNASTRLP